MCIGITDLLALPSQEVIFHKLLILCLFLGFVFFLNFYILQLFLLLDILWAVISVVKRIYSGAVFNLDIGAVAEEFASCNPGLGFDILLAICAVFCPCQKQQARSYHHPTTIGCLVEQTSLMAAAA